MGARLLAVGNFTPHEFRLKSSQASVGSAAENSLILDHKTVSRRHATLELRDGSYTITDLASTNGTFVNGQRLTRTIQLRDGDEISFGAVKYVLRTDATTAIDTSGSYLRSKRGIHLLLTALSIMLAGGFAVYLFVGPFSQLEVASLSDHPSAIATGAAALPPVGTLAPTAIATAKIEASNPGEADSSGSKDWLAVLNKYRTMAGLPAVADRPDFSNGDFQHSRYIAKNYGDQIRQRVVLGGEMHHEDPSKSWFTKEGLAAGLASDVDEMWDPSGSAQPSWAIDNWMQVPFHRLPLLDPHLHHVGYGYYCEKSICVAALNVNGESDQLLTRPAPLTVPIKYPPDGGSISLNSFSNEWPDPLTSCPDYAAPAGFPITLQLGLLVVPSISSYALTMNGVAAKLEACAFDAESYTNPDLAIQNLGREALRNYGAIVLIPRRPLGSGEYHVAVTTADRDYAWSFTVKR